VGVRVGTRLRTWRAACARAWAQLQVQRDGSGRESGHQVEHVARGLREGVGAVASAEGWEWA
jgi:hypothetical protein